MFGFQDLDVYKAAVSFLVLAVQLSDRAPKRMAPLADQLRRAASSIPLNIAEGNGKFEQDARRFYAIARGSALECAAILDAFEALSIASETDLGEGRQLLFRVVSMLSGLLRSKPRKG